MGINLDKMREKLAALRGEGNRDSVFWRPEDGEQDIRIVPTPDGDPFKEMWFHYNVEKGGFLCPKRNFGEECPVCDFASQLWREGVDNNDDHSKKTAKSLFDTEAGTDLTLTYGKPAGASFPQTKLVPRRRSSKLCEDLTPDKCAELLDSIPEFAGLFDRKSTEEVRAMLDNFINSQVADPESVSSETTKYGNKGDGEVNAVDAAFKELGAL